MMNSGRGSLAKIRAVIVSYTFKVGNKPTYIAGPPQDLYGYLRKRCLEITFIEQPMSYSEDLSPTAVVCRKGKEISHYRFPMGLFPLKKSKAHIQSSPFVYSFFKIRDVISTLYFFIKLKKKFDLYVGIEAVNTLLGILFKRLKIVKTVVYDIIDYSPRRFDNRFLNFLYHKLDKFCVYHSDYAWIQTERIAQKRFDMGINQNKACKQLIKVSGLNPKRVKKIPLGEIDRYGLIYIGGLFKTDGLELVIEAMPKLCQKFNKLHLTIIGHGDQRSSLEERVKELGLEEKVKFLGTVAGRDDVEKLLLNNSIGLAPYLEDTNSLKFYNDPSKPKLYLSCGLAVVITKVPPVAFEIEKLKAGRAISYNVREIENAIIELLESDKALSNTRENARKMALSYGWDNIFDNLFKKMQFSIN